MRHATLCLLMRNMPHTEVLLGLKKRGFGLGKHVGVGGGIEPGETALVSAMRELSEEIGVWAPPDDFDPVARLAFVFPSKPALDHYVEVFRVTAWRGEPVERDELKPDWFPQSQIPYEKMWADAAYWLPEVLTGRKVIGVFVFNADNTTIQTHNLTDWDQKIPQYIQLVRRHRLSYNQNAAARDEYVKSPWKVAERARFLELLRLNRATSLLEVGAGTGQDALFFKENGLRVVCTDVSTEMVRRCQEKGLRALVLDFLALDFDDEKFDALYGLNCILHVPNQDLPRVISSFYHNLNPGALVYIGTYGGMDFEGIWADDPQEPKRFFVYRSDETLRMYLELYFEILDFRQVPLEGEPGHFQSVIMKRRENPV